MSRLFTSEKGFIFTMTGAAIGLGNIWRFPYLVSNYGGGLFLVLYLLTLVGLGYFLLLGELALGKTTGVNVYDGALKIAEKEKSNKPKVWSKLVAGTSLSAAFMMNIVYLIAMGWILFYVVQNFLYLSDISPIPVTKETFGELTSSFQKQLFWSFLCVLSAAWLLCKGTIKHIEKVATIFIPAIFFIIIYLIFWVLAQGSATRGIAQMFMFDWEAIGFTDIGFNPAQFGKVLFVVVSQVFYSLSIGMGVAYIYGSFVTKETNLMKSARYIILLDTLFSLLATIFVLGISSAFNIPKDVGVNLTFITLPVAFEQMLGGSFVMFLFYSVLYLAAFTSLVSHFVPLVFFLNDKLKISKSLAFTFVAIADMFFVVFVLLSFSGIINTTIFGENLFDFTNMATDTVLLLSVLLMSLFVGKVAFKPIQKTLQKDMGKDFKPLSLDYIKIVFCCIAPVVLLFVIVSVLFIF